MMYYFSGMAIGFVLWVYLFRHTFFNRFSDSMGYKWSVLTLAAFGPISSGIGGADGGPFNIDDFVSQLIGIIFLGTVTILATKKRKKVPSADKEHSWLDRTYQSLAWIVVCGFLLLIMFLNVMVIRNNASLFDWRAIEEQLDRPCSQVPNNLFGLTCDKSG